MKKTTDPMVIIKNCDVAELLHPSRGESGFRFCFRLIRRVGELIVDGFRDAHGIVGIVHPQNVPADLPLDFLRDALFKIIPLKPELGFIVLGAVAVINAVQVEFPGAASV